MAQDKLEQFIAANCSELDNKEPGVHVWARIERRIPEREASGRIRLLKLVKIAAAILLLLSAGAVIGAYYTQVNMAKSYAALDGIRPELREIENYFQKEIEEKINVLASYDEDGSILKDFKQLDQSLAELKQELQIAPAGKEEQLIENLIHTYQTKIYILERVLKRIKSTNPLNEIPNDKEISI